MKGYKALNQDMSAKYSNMIYEIGKTYYTKKIPILCNRGYHFCEKLEQIQPFYDIATSRIFEVDATGELIIGEDKCVTNEITLIRELSKAEIKEYFINNLNILINDKFWRTRQAVAKQGCGLDKLIFDSNGHVRRAVAEKKYGLNILVYDKDFSVRCAVAKQGYGLDILINDIDCDVKIAAQEKLNEISNM